MIIVIDTREQVPYDFQESESVVGTLKTGDYSIEGLEHQITIERKSLPDLYGTVGKGRKRFERELERMKDMDYAAIVIEGTWVDIVKTPPRHSTLTPKQVVRSLIAWSQRFGVHIFAAGPRPLAQRMTYLLLDRFWKDRYS